MYISTYVYLQPYHLRFMSEGVEDTFQIFFRETHPLPNDLAMRNTVDVSGGTPITV
jgi:hypothetical protein